VTVQYDALSRRIAELSAIPSTGAIPSEAEDAVAELLEALERGELRAAERRSDGEWQAVTWVKQGILLGFRIAQVIDMTAYVADGAPARFFYFDKQTYPPRGFDLTDGVRIVPGGSSIRRGAYVAPGVVCMPPMYINVGAYVGPNTMVDSHALVGSCAQIGARVHLSAGAQIGGVLEPVNAAPVIVEDDALIGGNCGVYEGTVIRERAVLGAGVILTRGTPVFDLVRENVSRGDAARPLEIPTGAVVVPGARAVGGEWAQQQGLSLQTPVIVKYRDEQTDMATTLEAWLR
jgi:2,3,4,5-tetrahydropyridine-2-carboxylate N-succinyltransferase